MINIKVDFDDGSTITYTADLVVSVILEDEARDIRVVDLKLGDRLAFDGREIVGLRSQP